MFNWHSFPEFLHVRPKTQKLSFGMYTAYFYRLDLNYVARPIASEHWMAILATSTASTTNLLDISWWYVIFQRHIQIRWIAERRRQNCLNTKQNLTCVPSIVVVRTSEPRQQDMYHYKHAHHRLLEVLREKYMKITYRTAKASICRLASLQACNNAS